MKIVEKRPAIEMFDGIVNRWKEQLMQGQTDTNELVFRLRDFVQTELDINRIKSNRWIPCSERLPDNGVAVLVYTGENNFKVWLAEYSKYMEVWTLAGNYIPIKKNAVTHWMYLPEPPEKE